MPPTHTAQLLYGLCPFRLLFLCPLDPDSLLVSQKSSTVRLTLQNQQAERRPPWHRKDADSRDTGHPSLKACCSRIGRSNGADRQRGY